MSGKGSGKGSGRPKTEGDCATDWPPPTTMGDIENLIGKEKYDGMAERLKSAKNDSETLAIINSCLFQAASAASDSDESDVDEDDRMKRAEEFALKLILANNGATTAVVIFARTSDDTITYRSQLLRATEGYPLLVKYNKGGEKYILHPIPVTGKLVSVDKWHLGSKRYLEHHNGLSNTVQSLVDGGKSVIVLMVALNRLHRVPSVALDLAKDLEDLGGKPGVVQIKPMDMFDYNVSDVLHAAISSAEEKAAENDDDRNGNKRATHRDAARGLRDAFYVEPKHEKHEKQQKKINNEYSRYCDNDSESIDLGKNQYVMEACTAGDKISTEFVYSRYDWKPRLKVLRDDSSNANVSKVAEDYIAGITSSPRYTPGKQDARIVFNRSSRIQSEAHLMKNIKINEQHHPKMQLVKNLLYLYEYDKDVDVPELTPRRDDDSDDDSDDIASSLKQSSSSVAIISVNTRRRSIVIEKVLAITEKIAKKEVQSLLVTSPTRLSGYPGYIGFIKEVCELTGTKLILTECLGINPIDIAEAEDKRVNTLEESITDLIKDKFAPKSEIGRKMLKASKGNKPQHEDKRERESNHNRNKRSKKKKSDVEFLGKCQATSKPNARTGRTARAATKNPNYKFDSDSDDNSEVGSKPATARKVTAKKHKSARDDLDDDSDVDSEDVDSEDEPVKKGVTGKWTKYALSGSDDG